MGKVYDRLTKLETSVKHLLEDIRWIKTGIWSLVGVVILGSAGMLFAIMRLVGTITGGT